MGNDKGFRKMEDLVDALSTAAGGLSKGSLGLEGLESACEDARELYERLVVLRHKAREVRQKPAVVSEPAPPRPAKAEPAAPEVKAPEPIRLDTRPDAAVPRQTSLIEAIEEETVEAPKAAPKTSAKSAAAAASKPADAAPTLAETLGKAPITDLSRSIALSQKFWFVAELFNGDRILYDRSIETINRMEGLDQARNYIQQEVLAKLGKPAGEEALNTFMDLVERRFR